MRIPSLGLAVLLATVPAGERLLGDFEEDWTHLWMERRLARRATRFTVVEESGNRVLRAVSERAASGIWYMMQRHPKAGDTISWRWRVQRSLQEIRDERKKRGDDYAARFFIVFEPHFLSWKTRAICYVWASHESVGSLYASPHAETVKTIVLESGDARAGNWVLERRDIVADYRRAFGRDPEMISAVAIMVDTDDSGLSVEAWFDDVIFEESPSTPPPSAL